MRKHPVQFGAAYGAAAAKPLRLMSLLSANVRVYAIFLACMARDPRLFWWIEILPMTAILIIGLTWHRAVESGLIRNTGATTASIPSSTSTHSKDVTN